MKFLGVPIMGGACVYFVQQGESGPIKIGRTDKSVDRRLSAFQTANSLPLRLLFNGLETPDLSERNLHFAFRYSRILGEWFRPEEPLVSLIVGLQMKFPRQGCWLREYEKPWPRPNSPIESETAKAYPYQSNKILLCVELTRAEIDEVRQLFGNSSLTEMAQLASLIRNGIIPQREEIELQRKELEEKNRLNEMVMEHQKKLETALAAIPLEDRLADPHLEWKLSMKILAERDAT